MVLLRSTPHGHTPRSHNCRSVLAIPIDVGQSASMSGNAFTFTARDGSMESGRLWRLPLLIDQLEEEEDIEHPDVAVTHESGWGVSLFRSGLIVFGNVESRAPDADVHLYAGRAEQLIASTAVAAGRHDLITDWPWLPGNG